ncbi:hypothetical protein MGG_05779 [Pyricularia oryzae 70-15]|uniref:Beta-ketoacyl synthase C-terminal domain-containing protein n=1 Tax=Pyricularia oryzae (strain 70-15 / ATCC MYA-4617 / FGSC 8958) TaxID=242507 RepID=G4N0W8_PYRO7|nr:uncharacterized protein MGG_05779 [Pyricularia oryzae 70-15]EHA52346.1 hypothetical protein MGG_05779 [Pyricularia oryzae 70-15]
MRFSDADGYARGESVVCFMLKTISQTLADGDHIYAIVRETGAHGTGTPAGDRLEAQAIWDASVPS